MPTKMTDYYDYHPLVKLREPFAMTGPPGADVHRLGSAVAARCGLPLTDIDRLIEHRCGCSLATLIANEGAQRYAELEYELLRRAVPGTPYGIIVLGDHALRTRATGVYIQEHATLAICTRSAPELYERITGPQAARQQALHPMLTADALESIAHLTAFIADLTSGTRAMQIDLTGLSEHAATQRIVNELSAMS